MRITPQFTADLLRRLHEFLVRQPVTILIGELKLPLTQVEATIKELETYGVESDSRDRASRMATGRIRTLARQAQFELMRPIARAAKVLFKDDPSVRDALQLRKKSYSPSALIEALRALAEQAAPYKAQLMTMGIADNFVQRLHDAADALKDAIDARAKERGRRAGASVTKRKAALNGRAIVSLLDSMVAPRLAPNPGVLQEWKSLLKQGRVRSTPEEEGSVDGSTTPSPASTVPSLPVTPAAPAVPPTTTPQPTDTPSAA